MEKLTPEQRGAIARTAAAARWGEPVTQAELKRQAALQDAEWVADRAAQMGAEEIDARLADGAKVKPGKLTFDKKQKKAVAKKAAANTSAPAPAARKRTSKAKRR